MRSFGQLAVAMCRCVVPVYAALACGRSLHCCAICHPARCLGLTSATVFCDLFYSWRAATARLAAAGRRGGLLEGKRRAQRTALGGTVLSMASSIQFIKGIKEPSVPDVKLTRARDGSSGTAMFTFSQPSVFEASSDLGDITGLYLVDDEGTLQTVDVQAKFVNGKPDRIEAKYVMRSSFEWDR